MNVAAHDSGRRAGLHGDLPGAELTWPDWTTRRWLLQTGPPMDLDWPARPRERRQTGTAGVSALSPAGLNPPALHQPRGRLWMRFLGVRLVSTAPLAS